MYYRIKHGVLVLYYVRIGDIDGFGFGTGMSGADTADGVYKAANRGRANVDGSGLLYGGDFLPDLNEGGSTRTRGGDDFDNRVSEAYSAVGAEIGESCGCGGGSWGLMAGANFTDIALSTSYDTSSAHDSVWDHNTGTYGTGGLFPMPPSSTRSNQPGFVFQFYLDAAEIAAGTDVYFNMLFGDYDVSPATIRITSDDDTVQTVSIIRQAGNQDGLIQTAYAVIPFASVFTAVGSDYQGFLRVDFDAPREPYTAFDFVELSVDPIGTNPPSAVPEPATVLLLGSGFLGLAGLRRKFRK